MDKNRDINHLNYRYSNESIYILNNNKDIVVSYGKISYLNKTELFYQCNLKEDSSSSPILLTNNQKLIGIHYNTSKKYNKGNLLTYYNISIFISYI